MMSASIGRMGGYSISAIESVQSLPDWP